MGIRATKAQRRVFRLAAARRDLPEMLAWAGALTLVFGIVNHFALPNEPPSAWIVNLVFGPLFLVLAWGLSQPQVPDVVTPWVWAVCSTLLVGMLINVFRIQPTPANLAYVAAAITALGPLTIAWLPFLVSSAGMLVIAAVSFASMPDVVFSEVFLVCVVATFIGAALLRQRVKSLDALADAQSVIQHQATLDPMTEVLNRGGLERAIPALVANAQRNGDDVLVWFIDVRGLKAANDLHGHAFGDAIILATADALRACVRANDLVGRWGGDEFVVIGIGQDGTARELNERLDDHMATDPRLTGMWRGTVTVGFASGPTDRDVYALIAQADGDMYRRRTRA